MTEAEGNTSFKCIAENPGVCKQQYPNYLKSFLFPHKLSINKLWVVGPGLQINLLLYNLVRAFLRSLTTEEYSAANYI